LKKIIKFSFIECCSGIQVVTHTLFPCLNSSKTNAMLLNLNCKIFSLFLINKKSAKNSVVHFVHASSTSSSSSILEKKRLHGMPFCMSCSCSLLYLLWWSHGARQFYLDVLILKFGEANSCWTELANFLSLDATTIATISKLNDNELQSKLRDSKRLMKERNPKASEPNIIKR